MIVCFYFTKNGASLVRLGQHSSHNQMHNHTTLSNPWDLLTIIKDPWKNWHCCFWLCWGIVMKYQRKFYVKASNFQVNTESKRNQQTTRWQRTPKRSWNWFRRSVKWVEVKKIYFHEIEVCHVSIQSEIVINEFEKFMKMVARSGSIGWKVQKPVWDWLSLHFCESVLPKV